MAITFGYDAWKLATPPEYERDDDQPTPEEELDDYLAEMQASGRLEDIANAPKDGTEFDAILAETGERVTVRYSHQHRYWAGEDWFYDVNGDGGPHWPAEDFAGWLPEQKAAAAA